MKKFFSVVFAILYLTTIPTHGMYMTDEFFEKDFFETIGQITFFDGDTITIQGEGLCHQSPDRATVLLGDAPVYDLFTGYLADLADISPGQQARMAYDHTGHALAVWLYADLPGAAIFSVEVSENIQYGPDHTAFLSQCGKYRVTLTEDTHIHHPHHGPIHPADIQPGQAFFVWVDMITASHPSLVYPEKVVFILD